jgi:hypothetical protein
MSIAVSEAALVTVVGHDASLRESIKSRLDGRVQDALTSP